MSAGPKTFGAATFAAHTFRAQTLHGRAAVANTGGQVTTVRRRPSRPRANDDDEIAVGVAMLVARGLIPRP